MKMNKEKYEELLLRFGKELHDVGVTEDMKKLVESQYTNRPNLANAHAEETTDKFSYRHDGYMIEAERVVKLTIRRCK